MPKEIRTKSPVDKSVDKIETVDISVDKNSEKLLNYIIDEIKKNAYSLYFTIHIVHKEKTAGDVLEGQGDCKGDRVPFVNTETKINFSSDQNLNMKRQICPYSDLISLYHTILPLSPRCGGLTTTRQRHMRNRWLEFPDLGFWEQFFQKVSESKFLMGKANYRKGKPFKATLDWLIKPDNFIKVCEGRYSE